MPCRSTLGGRSAAASQRRWGAFFEFLGMQKLQRDWKGEYARTLTGGTPFLMEVFEREKMPGFTMAAMSAWLSHAPATSSRPAGFIAHYVSASRVPPEFIPLKDVRPRSTSRRAHSSDPSRPRVQVDLLHSHSGSRHSGCRPSALAVRFA